MLAKYKSIMKNFKDIDIYLDENLDEKELQISKNRKKLEAMVKDMETAKHDVGKYAAKHIEDLHENDDMRMMASFFGGVIPYVSLWIAEKINQDPKTALQYFIGASAISLISGIISAILVNKYNKKRIKNFAEQNPELEDKILIYDRKLIKYSNPNTYYGIKY